MTITRSQRNPHDVLVFIDVSGSTSKHISQQYMSDSVRHIINLAGSSGISVYESNHNLTQHYFCNPASSIPIIDFKFTGTSAVYDNIVNCMRHRFNYNSDDPCYVIIISDLEDNMSVLNKKHFQNYIDMMSNIWTIDILHPKTL